VNPLQRIASICTLLAACLLSVLATAQPFPDRPVKIVIPFGPGSGSDIVGRVLADELRKALNQSFVVENKPGGSAQIAAEFVAKATPDRTTLLLTTNTAHSANPLPFKSLRCDPVRDFTPIARISYAPYVVAVRADAGIANVAALVQEMRVQTDKLNYGFGNSTSQVGTAAFVKQAGVTAGAIPYKSMPAVLIDLLGGTLDFAFADLTSVLGLLKAGQLKPIAFTLAQRSAQLPDVPTVAETPGFAGFELISWIGLVGPAGIPRDVVDLRAAETNEILAKREIRERPAELGSDVAPSTSDEFGAFIRQQLDSWRVTVAAAGIQPE
jgi:tripartite-type tricarboxylate transporter receptor subunit TctC